MNLTFGPAPRHDTPGKNMKKFQTRSLVLVALGLAVVAATGVAQESADAVQNAGLARQNLRPYWHVFAAYSLVILLIGGWAVSIARRLKALEDRLLD